LRNTSTREKKVKKEVSEVQSIEGIMGKVYNHFGLAPAFTKIDREPKSRAEGRR
jgi:hypothetical protein